MLVNVADLHITAVMMGFIMAIMPMMQMWSLNVLNLFATY